MGPQGLPGGPWHFGPLDHDGRHLLDNLLHLGFTFSFSNLQFMKNSMKERLRKEIWKARKESVNKLNKVFTLDFCGIEKAKDIFY